jgi:hypothetical protein
MLGHKSATDMQRPRAVLLVGCLISAVVIAGIISWRWHRADERPAAGREEKSDSATAQAANPDLSNLNERFRKRPFRDLVDCLEPAREGVYSDRIHFCNFVMLITDDQFDHGPNVEVSSPAELTLPDGRTASVRITHGWMVPDYFELAGSGGFNRS